MAAFSHRLNHLFLGFAFVACALNWVLVTSVSLFSSERRSVEEFADQRVFVVEFLVIADKIDENSPDDGGNATN